MKKIGIIGNGFVGGATSLLECADVDVVIYAIDPNKCRPEGSSSKILRGCDLVFVCVPTPMHEDGTCSLDFVEDAVNEAQKMVESHRIIIKSTVPVGTSERLGVNFMPEFLTEANWREDFINCENWVVGDDSFSKEASGLV